MPEAVRAFIVGDGFLISFSLLAVAILIFAKVKENKRKRRVTVQRIRGTEPKLHRSR